MLYTGRKLKISSFVVGLLLLLGSYQNCALHQSDGRKQLDLLLARHSSTTPSNCLPYMSQFDTDVIFDDSTQTELVTSTSVPSCKITAGDEYSGAGIAVCTLLQEPKFLVTPNNVASSNGWTVYNDKVYYYKSETSEYVDMVIGAGAPTVPVGEEQYYGVAVLNGSSVNYHFIGSHTDLGIECRFSVDKAQFDLDATLRQTLAKRGSKLIHKFYQVCITGGNCSF